ncbi:hypothetical protein ACHAXT_000641 [Thalassiosira profunda]
MGRYSNVQAYSDDSRSMRTISYAQATTGRAESNAATEPGSSRDQEASRCMHGTDGGEGGDAAAAPSPPTKGNDDAANGTAVAEPEQPQNGSAASIPTCDTTSLFVGGLHPRIGDLHLQKLFSPYGEVVRINIVSHSPASKSSPHSKAKIPPKYMALQQSKGYAFVEYTRVESARLAMSRLDGRELMGRKLAVRPSRRKTSGLASSRDGDGKMEVTKEEARRQVGAVESKIDALKRAIEQKKKGI